MAATTICAQARNHYQDPEEVDVASPLTPADKPRDPTADPFPSPGTTAGDEPTPGPTHGQTFCSRVEECRPCDWTSPSAPPSASPTGNPPKQLPEAVLPDPERPKIAPPGFLIVAGIIAALPVLFFLLLSILMFAPLFLHRQNRSFLDVWRNSPAAAALPPRRHFAYTLLAATISFLILKGILEKYPVQLLWALCLVVPAVVTVSHVYAIWKRWGEIRPAATDLLQANTIYEDFKVPFFRTLLLGTTQLLLIAIYVTAIYGIYFPTLPTIEEDCDETTSSNCMAKCHFIYFYCFAVFIEIGYVFGTDTWHTQEASVEFWAKTFHALQRTTKWKPRTSNGSKDRLVVFYRCFYNTAISTTSLACLLIGLPLHVATERNATQFVLDVIGVYVLIEMKNIPSPQVFKVTKQSRRQTQPDSSDSDDSGSLSLSTSSQNQAP